MKAAIYACLWCVALLLASVKGYGQSYLFTQKFLAYNIPSGLIQNYPVNAMVMDGKGRIWIGTEHGLFVTNGNTIIRFLLSNPNDKVISSLLLDRQHLYVGTNEGINMVDLDSLNATALILKDPSGQTIRNYCMVVRMDAKGNLLYYTGYNTGAYYQFSLKTGKSDFLFNYSDGYRALKTDAFGNLKTLWAVETTGLLEHQLNVKAVTKTIYFKGGNGIPPYSITEAKLDSKDTLWCATDKGLLGMDIHTHQHRLLSFSQYGAFAFTDIELWRQYVICATANAGIILWNRETGMVSQIIHQPDNPYSILSNKISQLQIAPGNLLLAATDKGISTIALDRSLQPAYSPSGTEEIHTIAKGRNSWFAGIGNDLWQTTAEDFKIKNSVHLPTDEHALTATELKDGSWLVITNKQVVHWQPGKVINIQASPNQQAICERIVKLNDSTYYLTGQTGIYRWAVRQAYMTQMHQTDGEPYSWYHTVIPIGDSLLLANAHLSFIKVLRVNGDSLIPLSLLTTYGNINDWLLLDKNNLLLAGTNGLQRLNIPAAKMQPVDARFYEEIFRMAVGKDTLLFGERTCYRLNKNGVHPFATLFSKLWNIKQPEKVFADGSNIWTTDGADLYKLSLLKGIEKDKYLYVNLSLGHHTNPQKIELNAGDNLQLAVSSVCYLPYVQYSVRYRLLGAEQNWNNLDGEYIRYTQLRPGNYTLVTEAIAGGQRMYYKQLAIVAKPAWYQTIWALLGFLSAFVFIVVVIFRLRVQAIRKKSEHALALQRQMNELEHKALRAQMNPHFLFNTLNSINHYILNNDTKEASYYLTQFSRLVRQVLDNSRKELISLKQELNALSLYIELEMMRRNNEFDYSISIKKDVDAPSFLVPPLILQPFVENAVWHGLSTIPANGFIEITVAAMEGDGVCITIEDNGIGYNPIAKERGREEHQSFGMSGTHDRLQLMHPKNSYSIEALYNEEQKLAGTRVSVYIYND